jgi:hypothetical protein
MIDESIKDDVPALAECARIWRDIELMARENGDEVDAATAEARKNKYAARLRELGAFG